VPPVLHLPEELISDLNPYAAGLPKHIHLSADIWTMAKFRADEIQFRPRYVIDDFERWMDEFRTNPMSTVRPTQIDVKNNILALTGLTESAKRDDGETATTVRYLGIGTGTTAEDQNQTTLVTEIVGAPYARKDLSTTGQRKVYNQTGKYGVTWADTDLPTIPVTLREAALFTASSSGIMHARVLHNAFTINTGDLYVVQLNELHANGVL
jgi:hypothetical protein